MYKPTCSLCLDSKLSPFTLHADYVPILQHLFDPTKSIFMGLEKSKQATKDATSGRQTPQQLVCSPQLYEGYYITRVCPTPAMPARVQECNLPTPLLLLTYKRMYQCALCKLSLLANYQQQNCDKTKIVWCLTTTRIILISANPVQVVLHFTNVAVLESQKRGHCCSHWLSSLWECSQQCKDEKNGVVGDGCRHMGG